MTNIAVKTHPARFKQISLRGCYLMQMTWNDVKQSFFSKQITLLKCKNNRGVPIHYDTSEEGQNKTSLEVYSQNLRVTEIS